MRKINTLPELNDISPQLIKDALYIDPDADQYWDKCINSHIESYLNSHFSYFYLPEFNDTCINDILNNINNILEALPPKYQIFENHTELRDEIEHKLNEFYLASDIPVRQTAFTTNPHHFDRNYTIQQIANLRSIKTSEQKSEEWLSERHNKLTASNIWKALDSEANRNAIIREKCMPFKAYGGVNIDSPMHFGERYEPVSIHYYEHTYDTEVGDFGCINHAKYNFLAASPDGININPLSKQFGRMLESKNITNRDLDGIPKKEYWVQMQIQMEVCDLEACDFLECRFKEYENEEEYTNDGVWNLSQKGEHKGVILWFQNDVDNRPLYKYSPFGATKEEFDKWEEETMNINSNLMWNKKLFWRLAEVSLVTVHRNRIWYNTVHPILQDVYDTIQTEKISGFEHRLPKRATKATKAAKETKQKNIVIIEVNT